MVSKFSGKILSTRVGGSFNYFSGEILRKPQIGRANLQDKEKPDLLICNVVPRPSPNFPSLASDGKLSEGLGTRLADLCMRNGDLELKKKKKKKKVRFLLNLMRPGLRNNEFTYHGFSYPLTSVLVKVGEPWSGKR